MGIMVRVKTPFDVRDENQVLDASSSRQRYRLPDLSTGNAGSADPLEACPWQDLRGIVYGEPAVAGAATTKNPDVARGRLNRPGRTGP